MLRHSATFLYSYHFLLCCFVLLSFSTSYFPISVSAAYGHAPAHHPLPLLRGFRVHTLICRGSGLPLFFLLSPANPHDGPFAQRLLAWAIRLYQIRPRVVRLDAAYWGLRLIAWIHAVLGAVAVVAWNPKNQKNRTCLPPTWTREELGKRSAIERRSEE